MSGWLALAVGAVHCTGALLVLLFGMANDLLVPAILMVVAISAGMAIAMSGIRMLEIFGRRAVDRRMTDKGCHRFPPAHGLDAHLPLPTGPQKSRPEKGNS